MYPLTAEKYAVPEKEIEALVQLVDSNAWNLVLEVLEIVRAGHELKLHNSKAINVILRAQGAVQLSKQFLSNIDDIVQSAKQEREARESQQIEPN